MKEETVLSLKSQREKVDVRMIQSEKISGVTSEGVTIDGKDYGISDWGYKTLLRRFKIPVSFYSDLSQDLQKRVWPFAVKIAPEDRAFSQVILQKDTNEIQGVLNQDYCILPTEDILESVPTGWEMVSGSGANLFNPINRFRFVNKEIDIWDNTFIGFDFNSSEVGGSNFTVEALLFRQVCSNGMFAPRKLPVGFSSFVQLPYEGLAFPLIKAISEKLMGTLCNDARVGFFGECVKNSQASLVNMESYLENLGLQVDKGFAKKVSAVVEEEDIRSTFDLAMVISAEAKGLPFRRARKFELEAGMLLGLSIEEPAY